MIAGTETPVRNAPPARSRGGRTLRIALACVLGGLSLLPVWRLLDSPVTGLAGAATVRMVESAGAVLQAALVLLLIPAVLLMRGITADRLASALEPVERVLLALPDRSFAAVAAGVAFIAAAIFSAFVLQGQPNLVDAMAQLVQARYVAAGHLAGPANSVGAAWSLQQSLFTPAGWVSQYPPGHVFLLALGMKLGAVWAVGPFMLALTVFFTVLAAVRLVPDRPAVARVGGLLIALSPFLIAHAGAYMNHTSAAAFGAIAVYATVRADRGHDGWLLLAGCALGAMFATRPLSALTLGIVTAVWLCAGTLDRAPARLGRIAIGAAPFAILVALYNAHFFGSPMRFGYQAALGPAGGPGFGIDPWGNTYGLTQAVAWTSADLASLSDYLLETPVPAVAIVALWLLLAPRLQRGERLIAGWALAPLAAQLTYWHHGLFMGPRMLYESAPAWILLASIAGFAIIQHTPSRLAEARGWSPRVFAAALLGMSAVAGVLIFSPMRLWSYAQRPQAPAVALSAAAPALVFVHGGWTSRLSMRLAASGMRLDSVETALRQNPTCRVQSYADARASGSAVPVLDLAPRATSLPESVEISPGNRIRIGAGEATLAGECGREAGADRFGTLDVSPILWLGDLPGIGDDGRMFVRDLGPIENAAVLAAFPRRRPWVLVTTGADGSPQLVDYMEAMKMLWGGSSPGGA